jgi:NADPH:quinone reductase-like Zn-dependent oxidoreductase
MGERSIVRHTLCVPLPGDLDDIIAAAGANPGMASWAALTERARFVAGEAVLINGATGISGRLAIQIAKFLGASRIIATGRNGGSGTTLRALGADVTIPLDLPPAELAATFKREIEDASVDIVLDYLWGSSAETIIGAVSGHGVTARRIRFVQIGSLQSPTISLTSGALRSSGIEIMGSGMGSVSSEGLVRSAKGFLDAILPGNFDIAAQAVPLCDVSEAWMRDRAKRRVVLTMTA